LPIHRVVVGMSLSDLQIYVCQRWEEMFKAYQVNVLAINTYVRKLEEWEELAVDTEHSFRINVMCRLMLCGFSRLVFTVQQSPEAATEFDWALICETDKTVSGVMDLKSPVVESQILHAEIEDQDYEVLDDKINSDADSNGHLRGFVEHDRSLSGSSSSGSSSSSFSSSSLSRKKKRALALTKEALFLSKSSESFKPARLVRRELGLGAPCKQARRTPGAPFKKARRTIYLDSDEDVGMFHCLCFNHPEVVFVLTYTFSLHTRAGEDKNGGKGVIDLFVRASIVSGLQSIINEIKILQSEMICLQGSPVGFDTTFSSPMSSDISTASTFVTQVVEEDSFQPVAIFGRVEEVSRGATHVGGGSTCSPYSAIRCSSSSSKQVCLAFVRF
jgi:hypothetical protein